MSRLRAWAGRMKRDVHAVWLAARDPRTPLRTRLLGLAIAAYALSPIDLIPDFIPVLGLLDDLILIPAGVWLFVRMIPAELLAEHRRAAAAAAARPISRGGAAAIVLLWIGAAAMLAMHLDRVVAGPVVLVGSSMGGWLMLLVALAWPERVQALVGIAAAPDFTDWGFDAEARARLIRDGRIEEPSDYGPEPSLTTLGFWRSGQASLLLGDTIGFDGPVRLLHGQRDADVPFTVSLTLAERLRSADVQTILIKDGDHRLSRDADLRLLTATVALLLESL